MLRKLETHIYTHTIQPIMRTCCVAWATKVGALIPLQRFEVLIKTKQFVFVRLKRRKRVVVMEISLNLCSFDELLIWYESGWHRAVLFFNHLMLLLVPTAIKSVYRETSRFVRRGVFTFKRSTKHVCVYWSCLIDLLSF